MPPRPSSPIEHARDLLRWSLAAVGLTAVHHVYGGVVYSTPWRVHGAAVALAIGVVLVPLFFMYRSRASTPLGRAAGWVLALLAFGVVVLALGVFEGLYNHVLKNLLFLIGAPQSLLFLLFPPPTYELPNDLGFELTGVAQVLPSALAASAALQFLSSLKRTGDHSAPARIEPGATLDHRELESLSGQRLRIPDGEHLIHLQFRRFAGCPVCNLHLRSFVRRHNELVAAGIREIVVFHSTREELEPHTRGFPFAVVGDPDKRLYRAFAVEQGPRAMLDPRAWLPILRAVINASVAIARGEGRLPATFPGGGRYGLPADFLIGRDGRALAVKYGEHVDDHWSVDDVLDEATTWAVTPSPSAR